MCIIQGETTEVSDTCIFVSPLEGKQITIYSNYVAVSGQNTAMILPVPQGPVHFVDLQDCEEFFPELDKCFIRRTRSLGSTNGRTLESDDCLEVLDVGSYQVSVVPTLAEFKNLDEKVFTLQRNVENCLYDHYRSGYSFIVCRLRPGSQNYHPLAYLHNRLPNGRMFIPTRHFHLHSDGQSHTDWDHRIYVWGGEMKYLPESAQAQRHFEETPIQSRTQDETVLNVLQRCGLLWSQNSRRYRVTYYHHNHDLEATVA